MSGVEVRGLFMRKESSHGEFILISVTMVGR